MIYLPRRACTTADVRLRGLNVHLYEWHGSGPTAVLIHGWGDSGATFQFLVDDLAHSRGCIAPDLRGFGCTEWPREGYWFADYLADLDALLEHLSPTVPVDLIGHSMGGNIAMLYAGVRPERVRKVVNLEGFGLPRAQPQQAPARYREWLAEVREGPLPYAEHPSFHSLETLLRKRNPRTSLEKIAFIARSWAHATERGRVVLRSDPRHKWINPVLYRREEAEACWREITAKVLLVMGAASQLMQTPASEEVVATFTASVRDLRTEVLEDAGHMLHHERPDAVAQLIENFLTSD
jgi:pimeloyl-ACP methyl ester carboxylesterase